MGGVGLAVWTDVVVLAFHAAVPISFDGIVLALITLHCMDTVCIDLGDLQLSSFLRLDDLVRLEHYFSYVVNGYVIQILFDRLGDVCVYLSLFVTLNDEVKATVTRVTAQRAIAL